MYEGEVAAGGDYHENNAQMQFSEPESARLEEVGDDLDFSQSSNTMWSQQPGVCMFGSIFFYQRGYLDFFFS